MLEWLSRLDEALEAVTQALSLNSKDKEAEEIKARIVAKVTARRPGVQGSERTKTVK